VIPLARGATAVEELVRAFGGELDEAARGRSVSFVAEAGEGDARALSPVSRVSYVAAALAAEALVVITPTLAARVPPGARWIHPSPSFVVASLLEEDKAIDERAHAFVHPGAIVPASVSVGPFAVIHDGVVLGEGCRVGAHAVLHPRVRAGARVVIGDGAVVGRPGFGFATHDGSVRRVPHLAGVVLDDDVEIGALATVDAGVLAPTRVGRGTKLDAHVHVGHNGDLGPGVLVAAQAGFAGSVHVGAGAQIGGQAGVADHVVIGAGARLAAKAGVIGDVGAGETVAGYPALPRLVWLRATATLLGLSRKR
jgi:UDP-3-O-[3-hydroxymyristoyl] glucosamine N-acyltransferase